MHVGTRTHFTLITAAALALGLAAAMPSRADDEPDLNAPATSSTDVKGTPPVDMRGLWLLLSHGALMSQGRVAPNKIRTTVELWRVDGQGNRLDVELWTHDLPPAWQQALDLANGRFEAWSPTDEQIADLGRSLDQLPAADPNRYLKHLYAVVAPDQYEGADLNTGGVELDGSVMSIRVQHQYRPQPVGDKPQAQLMSDDAIYVVRKADTSRLEGEHTRLILAAGFLPIPVSTQGQFTMYRLRGPDALPKSAAAGGAGWLARIWDSLSRGCK